MAARARLSTERAAQAVSGAFRDGKRVSAQCAHIRHYLRLVHERTDDALDDDRARRDRMRAAPPLPAIARGPTRA